MGVSSSGAGRSNYLMDKNEPPSLSHIAQEGLPQYNTEVTGKPKTIKLLVKNKICMALGQTKMSEIGLKKHWDKLTYQS